MAYSSDPDYRPTIGILLYPGYTLLDLAGPQIAIGNQGNTLLFWKDKNPVRGDNGPELVPTTTFAEYDGHLDVLLVPGGFGVEDAMGDPEIISFLRRAAKTARIVSSACTGTLLLAAAGLLDGRRVTTHWFVYETIEKNFPEIELVRDARVVIDGNVYTSGGVTAGIELGIRLLEEAKGARVAATTELAMCYDPQPPFGVGSPSKAGPDLLQAAIKYAEKIGTEKLWQTAP
ncbi:DJ-1/PfpI family protein [Burkholderia sp. Bp9143]|uniref:DJ-1/PfpI family protein n=1 Tax=Burkholderia sp. Bp9143 TaxID=2184574 RepID=UPI000F598ACA|nr:DJ-1/PfpI family protein [Burkholderia sp. Bp9143]RQR32377.1 DJ-1/PfpI family protein [Burkholderia sp. Bp9143]